MATNKMLIDATHPEETRVVVLRNGRVEEFDFESAARKILRGNIYLAKVTRVEPSLQAAFVDYGGNRHGFLAFNEIHPDYYQIPMADRQALLDEEAAAEAEEEAAADARAERLARRQRRHGEGQDVGARGDDAGDGEQGSFAEAGRRDDLCDDDDEEEDNGSGVEEAGAEAPRDDDAPQVDDRDVDDGDDAISEAASLAAQPAAAARDAVLSEAVEPVDAADRHFDHDHHHDDVVGHGHGDERPAHSEGEGGVHVIAPQSAEPDAPEQVGSEDALEELPSRPRRRPRSYKIQEVIKRRQVILVQVVKEERGNKGAALTTYLSLAGRYTVLMPNTARGGGISRKITNPQDRKRLKSIAHELEVPEGMGLIIRTAGAARTKQEIKRDFEYLLRLWESVRDLTLQSTAPSLVYEEGNLIKRSIRDLYNKDVEELVVAGEAAHREAHDFMRMLMPSHAKNVIEHQGAEPLFTKYGIERQLNAMFSPFVTLKSGGYLVINQTEALVAVDVNSGKSTREFSIEETALNTNLEAADEIARQVKLRDLAGLVVIDFIDMEEKRNNRSVERRLKDALRFDRARIQLGRISHFGLMEMSRQRLRTGVLEGSTSQCPHCQGTGIIRSTESVALAVLRGLEDAIMAGARTSLVATMTAPVALYILNHKRAFLNEMEARHGIFVSVQASDKLQGANFQIEKGTVAPVATRRPDRTAVNMDWGFDGEEDAPSTEAQGVSFVDDVEADSDGFEVVAANEPRGRGEGREQQEGRDGAGRGEGRREGGRRRRRRGRRGSSEGARGERHVEGRVNGGHADGLVRNGSAAVSDLEGPEGSYPIEVGGAEDFAEPRGSVGDDGAGAEGGEARGVAGARSDESGGRRRRRGRRGGRRGRDRNRQPQLDGAPREDNGGWSEGDLRLDGSEAESTPRAYDHQVSTEPLGLSTGEGVQAFAGDRSRGRQPRQDAGSGSQGVDGGNAWKAPVNDPQPAVARHVERSEMSEPKATQASVQPAAPVTTPVEQAEPRVARSRSVITPSEPKLERVVVRPDQSVETGGEAVSAEPARKGWWQRRLGG